MTEKPMGMSLMLIAFMLASCFAGVAGAAPSKPNILFIAVDDLNDWIGPLGGNVQSKTPNLDRLADLSMVFANAHCASPACSPSRLAIMTGVQPSKSGSMQNEWYDGPQWRKQPMLKHIETIEQFFKNRGYETLAGGKIYHTLSPPWQTINHAEAGSWDFYFPSVHVPIPYQIRAPKAVINPPHFKGTRHPYFTWGPLQVRDEKMADSQVVDWACYELSRKHDKPFYLACGLFRPHMPWEVPQKYFDRYALESIADLNIQDNDLKDAFDHGRRSWHKYVLANKQWKHVIQAYLASIAFTDVQLGRLLDGLEASAYRDNTIVVLWSDHGMHIGEKENWEKFTLWEESTRVPLMIKVPGLTQAGSRSDQPASLLDIYPTLAEAAGFAVPKHCDGVSLLPLLKNPETKRSRSALTSFKFNFRKVQKRGKTVQVIGHALRGERYRYIYYETVGLEELYDHQTDPGEYTNLAYKDKYAMIVHGFRNELMSRVNGLTLSQMAALPDGYTIDNGHVSSVAFKTMAR